MYIEYNANPMNRRVGDCVIRAIAKASGQNWDRVYTDIAMQGFLMYDMPSSNAVWGTYLTDNGYEVHSIPNSCPDCYSIRQFCEDFPKGTYIVATGTHVLTIIDGDYFDTWDSGDEIPIYYFRKE